MFNLYGQICLPFSALWFLLTAPVTALTDFFSRRFAEMQPQVSERLSLPETGAGSDGKKISAV